MKKTVLFLIASTILITSAAQPVFAADPPVGSGQALEIAPPVVNLVANPGQTLTTQISLRDVSSGSLVVTGEINDFVAAGEDGTPKILIDESEEQSPYSLKTWVRPLSQLTLKPREIKNFPVTIAVPANAAPGGYFGVVRFTAKAPELDTTGVSLSASLGALMLVRVSGQAKEGLSVEEFYVSKDGKKGTLFESAPLQFIERLRNSGNVHVQPAGQVTITDMFGKKLAVTGINQPPRNVLPASVRKFDQALDKSVIGNKRMFGRYTAKLDVVYGDSKQSVTKTITFWVVPYKLITAAVVGLVAAFFALRFALRRYNQSIINKAQKTTRKK